MRMGKHSVKKLLLAASVLLAVLAFFSFDLGQYFSLGYLQESRADFDRLLAEHPLATAGAFFAIYVAVTALSLPGAAIMTLAGGALFGLGWGLLLVSFASSLGATLAFLVARYLLRSSLQQRFGQRLAAIDRGVDKDGAFYLFALRLVPAFPFFVINLLMGLTAMRTLTFYWVSQVGMLPGTVVYVNAGTQLGQLDSLSGLLSPGLLGSFVLLGLFPLLARKGLDWLKHRRAMQDWTRPKQFDRNLIVIGAGSGGLVSAYIAAAVRAKVTLIEKHQMGGDCLNTGCVPSKALIRSAKAVHQASKASTLGLNSIQVDFDFAAVMQRVQEVIKTIEPHDSVERYTQLGVECIQGEARLVSPWEVEVNGQRLSARHIVLATGAQPRMPDILGLSDAPVYTSDTVWTLREQPSRLLVLGGGPIGCELSQAFHRLGSQVHQVDRNSRLLGKEDAEVSELVESVFREEGIHLHLGAQAIQVLKNDEGWVLEVEQDTQRHRIGFDAILVAVGRQPRLQGYGLEDLGVRASGTIDTDDFLRTNIPSIFAVGDVAGPYQFTHAAAHQAWYAAVNALFGNLKKFRVDYRVMPRVTFTDPEVAQVGLNETQAQAEKVAYEVTRYGLDDLDRAIADSHARGFVKVLTVPGKDRILGVTIVGAQAGELLAEFVLAMKHGLGLNKILGTIHPYPTMAEANKYAAGQWKQAHKPEALLQWVERYHRWRRGGA
nr:FAD-dependent oxidoreductase [Oceanococcus sp. HetDA_MAG_MS8]